ncbi:MAG: hypothetical protein LBI33_12800 [Propionibacteriaceae bacterium]|jgi:hypothetical protein|nr:hypothetical protein [Propionibacteriaceae bacterium]
MKDIVGTTHQYECRVCGTAQVFVTTGVAPPVVVALGAGWRRGPAGWQCPVHGEGSR